MSTKTENVIYYGDNKVHLRLRNRRVIIEKESDDKYSLKFIRTTTPEEREDIVETDNVKLYCRGKIMMTGIKLTRDVFEGLFWTMVKFIEEGHYEFTQ